MSNVKCQIHMLNVKSKGANLVEAKSSSSKRDFIKFYEISCQRDPDSLLFWAVRRRTPVKSQISNLKSQNDNSKFKMTIQNAKFKIRKFKSQISNLKMTSLFCHCEEDRRRRDDAAISLLDYGTITNCHSEPLGENPS